jgi:hypothetical protein
MDRLAKEVNEIKLHPDSKNREGWFKVSKAWNPSTSLLRHSQIHTSRKPQEHREECAKKGSKIV